MEKLSKSIEVDVPVRTAYNQWTQFEDFPLFMPNVLAVRQLDETHLHWSTRWWQGVDENWEAEIVDQIPDQRITWKSITGKPNAGMVSFEPLGEHRTRVSLAMAYEPQGFIEHLGDLAGLIDVQVKRSLEGFKHFIEQRQAPTGAWRGEVRNEREQPQPPRTQH